MNEQEIQILLSRYQQTWVMKIENVLTMQLNDKKKEKGLSTVPVP